MDENQEEKSNLIDHDAKTIEYIQKNIQMFLDNSYFYYQNVYEAMRKTKPNPFLSFFSPPQIRYVWPIDQYSNKKCY